MRLIDADRLLRDPYFQEDRFPSSNLIRMAVREQRTVDAVKVVRCKDCIYNETGGCEHSESADVGYRPDYFCADGERKDNDCC